MTNYSDKIQNSDLEILSTKKTLKNKLKIFLQVVFVVAIFSFLSKSLVYNWSRLNIDFNDINFLFFNIAIIFFAFAWVIAALAWGFVIRSLGPDLKYSKSVQIWIWSQSARYIPGSVWQVFGRIYMAEKEGIKKGQTVASIAIETANLIISSLIVFALSLPFWRSVDGLSNYIPYFSVGFTIFIFLHPKVFNKTVAFFIKRLDKDEHIELFDFKHIILMLLPYFLVWITFGVGFYLLAVSLTDFNISFLPVATGSFALSWVVGFLVIIAPGGLGAREIALVYFLGLFTTNPIAVLLSVLSRILLVIAELLLLVFSFLFGFKNKLRS